MQTRSVFITFLLIASATLTGCAAYTVASVGSYVTTGKSLGDHAGSTVTGGDCNLITNTYNGKYVCEMPVVYNRNGF
jgi:predicted small secreted protein